MKIMSMAMSKTTEILSNHINGLKSTRIALIWLFSISYLIMAFYSLIKYENSASTVITSTAGLLGVIFSGYVFTKVYKSKNDNNFDTLNK